MLSYRESLTKIGISRETTVSYQGFSSRPQSLRQAIRSMDAPAAAGRSWQQVSDDHLDKYWTDEVQGVAFDGENWIFSCDARQSKPGHNDKAIYVFKGGQPLNDGNWICMIAYKDIPHPIGGLHESDDHWGQLTCYNGFVYVSHFWEGGSKKGQTNVVVFKNNSGYLEYDRWIALEAVNSSYPEFQAINPWDGMLYTCFGGGDVSEFFLHDPDTGAWTRKTFPLGGGGGWLPRKVQGACFSPNGHLYVAVDSRFPPPWDKECKWIFYYSALNGTYLGEIPVIATGDNHELEGICYGNVSWPDGRTAQIHAVLLENRDVALDNIWFKSFSTSQPDIV